jgi:hypothetical protein
MPSPGSPQNISSDPPMSDFNVIFNVNEMFSGDSMLRGVVADFGVRDSEFESWLGHILFLCVLEQYT